MDIKVAHIIDPYTIVLNKGSLDGIKAGQRFLIYSMGDDIIDPDTNISLGKLEIVKGTGKVTHLQDHIATIGSDMKESPSRIVRRDTGQSYYQKALASALGLSGSSGYSVNPEIEEILPAEKIPFVDPSIGDIAKLI